MDQQVTIVVVPRDRFSSLPACIRSIVQHTSVPYRLMVLDLGYAAATLQEARQAAGQQELEVVACPWTIPVVAFGGVLSRIETPYVAWVDNDTYVSAGWMEALLDRAARGARVVLPLTLEREGLDGDARQLPLRNHISHAELRRVQVEGVEYVFDHKPYRRAAPEELPAEPHTVDFFELHTFFAESAVLRLLELPEMVVREHIDIGIQLHRLGIPIWCEPRARVHFDNIHERPTRNDLKFFFYRWDEKLIDQSHALFLQRWGYRFYNEQFLKNWAFRRKVFSVCRWLGLPSGPADFVSRVLNKLCRAPLPPALRENPLPQSERVFAAASASAEAEVRSGI